MFFYQQNFCNARQTFCYLYFPLFSDTTNIEFSATVFFASRIRFSCRSFAPDAAKPRVRGKSHFSEYTSHKKRPFRKKQKNMQFCSDYISRRRRGFSRNSDLAQRFDAVETLHISARRFDLRRRNCNIAGHVCGTL